MFDPAGRLSAVIEPVTGTESITTSYSYDVAGNRVAMTDGRNNTTRYTYNSWGLLESTIEPATATTPAERTYTNTYDTSRRLVAQQLPDGVRITSTYDARGGRTSETATSTTGIDGGARHFVNDKLGRRVSAHNDNVSISWNFDDRSLPASQTTTRTQPNSTSEVEFRYDAAGRLIERNNQAGPTRFAWDSYGQVDQIGDPLTGTRVNTEYTADSQVELVTSDNGALDRRLEYDQFGRQTSDRSYDDATLMSETIAGYHPAGNIATVNETHAASTGAASRTTTFGYDRANRLISRAVTPRNSNGTFGTETVTAFDWDAASNRTLNCLGFGAW